MGFGEVGDAFGACSIEFASTNNRYCQLKLGGNRMLHR